MIVHTLLVGKRGPDPTPAIQGPLHAVRALAPAMIERGRGVIVNTSSLLGREPVPNWAAYGASRAALETLTRAWSKELGPKGIRVNAVAPGFVATALNETIEERTLERIVAQTPLRVLLLEAAGSERGAQGILEELGRGPLALLPRPLSELEKAAPADSWWQRLFSRKG